MAAYFKHFLRFLSLFLLAGAAYFFANHYFDKENRPSEVAQIIDNIGKPAIDFQGHTFLNRNTLWQFSSQKGNGIILHFWATWCAPCIEELPNLVELAKKWKTKGLVVVAVSVDKNWKQIDQFFKNNPELAEAKDVFTIVLDDTYHISSLYQVDRFPESFLINRKFIVELRLSGEQNWLSNHSQHYYDRILR